jgi:hypothetical protein
VIVKQRIVHDGVARVRGTPEFQARLRELRDSIRARHAEEMGRAGLFGRMLLRLRMAGEYRRERQKIAPSPHSLYFGRGTGRD